MKKKQYKKRIKKVKSSKMNTMIYLYDGLEQKFFERLEKDETVISYQKNVPLTEWQKYISIDDFDSEAYNPELFTSDFLMEFSDGHFEVREIVERDRLTRPSTLNLLELSRRYWEARGIDWGILTDKEVVEIG